MSMPVLTLFILFFLLPAGLELAGFQWKSTEMASYFAGFFFGIALGWFPL